MLIKEIKRINNKYRVDFKNNRINSEELLNDLEKTFQNLEKLRNFYLLDGHFAFIASNYLLIIQGIIHDLRNACDFIIKSNGKNELKVKLSYLERFFQAYDLLEKQDLLESQIIYLNFLKFKEKLYKLIDQSLASLNYKIIENENAKFLDISADVLAWSLLLNELYTNYKKYGEDADIQFIFTQDYWEIIWKNKIKKEQKRVYSGEEGLKFLNELVEKYLDAKIIEKKKNNETFFIKIRSNEIDE